MTTTDVSAAPDGEARPLTDLTRDDLNQLASTSGIDEPERLGNKAEVIAAIEIARDGPGSVLLVGENGPEIAGGQSTDERKELVAYRFTGDGSVFFGGVPATDLTQSEADRIAAARPDVFHAMTSAPDGAMPLYERVEEPS